MTQVFVTGPTDVMERAKQGPRGSRTMQGWRVIYAKWFVCPPGDHLPSSLPISQEESGGKAQRSPCSGSRAVPLPHDPVLLQMKDVPGLLHCLSHSRLSTCGTLISAGGSSGALIKRDNRNWRVN